jgi:hypothetical protein
VAEEEEGEEGRLREEREGRTEAFRLQAVAGVLVQYMQ